MQAAIHIVPQARALARIRSFSRPIGLLLTVALAAAVVVPTAQILAILFLPTRAAALPSFLSFNGWSVGLGIGAGGGIPLGTLSLEQRWAVAGLDGLCAVCSALALFQLRSLFVLYSSGVIFASDNIRRIKLFGMWLVAAAIAGNVSGRLFMWVTHTTVLNTANAALTVVLGAMIYVIAHVMELGREADLERKDFI
jgi:hypothetical protein